MRALHALCLTAGTLTTVAQTAPQTSIPPAASSHAASPTTTFHSDTLHLTYTYPAVYTDASALVGPAMQAALGTADPGQPDAGRCITLPFSAADSAQGLAVVLIVRADAACLKKKFTPEQLPDFTQGEVQGLTASGARTQFGQPIAFSVGAHPAQLLRGTFELPTGQPLHAMVACVLLKPDIACWQFLASSETALQTMAAFPVSLDGSAPQPLIPASLFSKP